MRGIWVLVVQCIFIFITSMACGSLPLFFKSSMSEQALKSISVFGMGILVSAALTIIIPEGVSTLNAAADDDDASTQAIGLSLLSGFALMLLIESLIPHPSTSNATENPPLSPATPPERGARRSDEVSHPILEHANSQTPIFPKAMHLEDGEEPHHMSSIHGLSATLGMVIHGAADGIALGASSLAGRGSLGFVVFLAVVVHKGPTALGLSTTLLSLRLPPSMINKRLLIFSSAAPLGAVTTYLLVSMFGMAQQHNVSDNLGWWTGIALLFSGGSFLYVATVIQPLSSDDHHHSNNETHRIDLALGKYVRTALLFAGMILPVILVLVVGDHDD